MSDVDKIVKELQEKIIDMKNNKNIYQAEMFQQKFNEIAQQFYFLKEEIDKELDNIKK